MRAPRESVRALATSREDAVEAFTRIDLDSIRSTTKVAEPTWPTDSFRRV